MKAVVIQEEILQNDITPEELTELWQQLGTLPEVDKLEIYKPVPYPSPEQLEELVGDAEALFGVWIGPDLINEGFLNRHPNLRYIATLGHGWETYDTMMVRARGVTITNTIYGSQTIAEHAFALLMELCHHISIHDQRIKTIDWSDPGNRGEFCRTETPQIELYGKTIGIIGLGAIGFAMAQMAYGFGMNVITYSRTKKQGAAYDFIDQVDDMEELLKRSDFISLHMPHTPQTQGMINAETIAKMKDGVILINTARGALIDEQALAEALESGKVYAAGLDVLTEEPPIHGSPLLNTPHVTITGHIAWLTRESRIRAIRMAIDNFQSYLEGNPKSVIY